MINAASGRHTVRIVKAGVAKFVAASVVANLLQLDPMPVLVLLPGSCAADLASRLADVPQRVVLELGSVLAGSAAAVGFHSVALPIAAAARTMERRVLFILSLLFIDQ